MFKLLSRAVLSLVAALGLLAGGVTTAEAASSQHITGTVTCINSMVQGVWIQAESSSSNFANWKMPITLGGLSQATFDYTLNRGGRYQVHVGCGGSRSSWAVDAKSGWTSGSGHKFTCNDIPFWLRILGSAVMKNVLGYRFDLTQGVAFGTCRVA